MKHILVPLDFSPGALHAADVAIALAQKAGATVCFFHAVVNDPHVHSQPERDDESSVGHARIAMTQLIDKAEQEGVLATSLLTFDDAQTSIEQYVKTYEIDLVVLGSQVKVSSTGLEFLRLISGVPVLAIKNNGAEFNPRKILFASDFKTEWIKPFGMITELAALYETTVDLVYVSTPYHFVATREVYSKMKGFMQSFGRVNYKPHVYNALIEEVGIEEFAEDNKVDLICMTTRGHSALQKLFMPSVAEGVLKNQEKPMLIVNIK